MKISKQKTSLSCMWDIHLFGRNWLFGYLKVNEAEEMGEDNANIILNRDLPEEVKARFEKELKEKDWVCDDCIKKGKK